MATNRIDWIDAAKGIGILLVMFGHCWLSAEYTYWLTAFHMPLFFILMVIPSPRKDHLLIFCTPRRRRY